MLYVVTVCFVVSIIIMYVCSVYREDTVYRLRAFCTAISYLMDKLDNE